MKRSTRKARKATHARPRGDKWPGDSWWVHASRAARRRGSKAWR